MDATASDSNKLIIYLLSQLVDENIDRHNASTIKANFYGYRRCLTRRSGGAGAALGVAENSATRARLQRLVRRSVQENAAATLLAALSAFVKQITLGLGARKLTAMSGQAHRSGGAEPCQAPASGGLTWRSAGAREKLG